MIRTYNFTGRKKIPRELVKIKLIREKNEHYFFDGNVNLRELHISNIDSKVYLEFYYRHLLKRFDIGTVEEIIFPENRSLSEFKYVIDNLHLRVLVVDHSDNDKIVAFAEHIPLHGLAQRKSILPVISEDLENVPWKLRFDENEGPELVFNTTPADLKEKYKSDPLVFLSISSSALREILQYILIINEQEEIYEDSWEHEWIIFAKKFAGSPPKGDKKEILNWIDDVVQRFCNNMRNKYNLHSID